MLVRPKAVSLLASEDTKIVVSLHPRQKWVLDKKDSLYIVSRKNIMFCLEQPEFNKYFQEKKTKEK